MKSNAIFFYRAEIFVVFAYGTLINFRHNCVNHFMLFYLMEKTPLKLVFEKIN